MPAVRETTTRRSSGAQYPTVLRSVFLVTTTRGRAEDITQEASNKVYAHWRRVSKLRASRRVGSPGPSGWRSAPPLASDVVPVSS